MLHLLKQFLFRKYKTKGNPSKMENDSQDFQPLYSAWSLPKESINGGWEDRKEGKKQRKKKREIKLHNLRKGTDLFICFLECSEHLVLLATRNHFCCAKRFHTWTEAKNFFHSTVGRKNTVEFCELQRENSLLTWWNLLNLRKRSYSWNSPLLLCGEKTGT